jgi:hypothetical protein
MGPAGEFASKMTQNRALRFGPLGQNTGFDPPNTPNTPKYPKIDPEAPTNN